MKTKPMKPTTIYNRKCLLCDISNFRMIHYAGLYFCENCFDLTFTDKGISLGYKAEILIGLLNLNITKLKKEVDNQLKEE